MPGLFGRTGNSGVLWLPTNIGGCVFWVRSDLAWQDAAKTVPCVADSLIWTGEDKSGTARDATQATEAARLVYKTAQYGTEPAWLADGVDDFMVIPADILTTISIVLRMKADSSNTTYMMPFTKAANTWTFQMNPDVDAIRTLRWITAGWDSYDYTEYPLDTWAHIVVTQEGTVSKLYHDGVYKVGRDDITAIPENEQIINLAKRSDGYFFKGYYREAIMYNKVLSPEEITQLYGYDL